MSRPDIWMPLFVGDYLRDTSRLTRDQHGGYLLLIMDYWVKGPLPDDDEQLAAIVKANLEEWSRLRPRLEPFFRVEAGMWHHKRIDEERGKAAAQIERLEQLARAGREAQGGLRKAGRFVSVERSHRSATVNAAANATANARGSTTANASRNDEGEGEGDLTKGASGSREVSVGDDWDAAVTRDVAALQ
jgi:uncharacterized protein YdaU (DUF1376 family)